MCLKCHTPCVNCYIHCQYSMSIKKFKQRFYSAVRFHENCFFVGHFPVAVAQKSEGKERTLLKLNSMVGYSTCALNMCSSAGGHRVNV